MASEHFTLNSKSCSISWSCGLQSKSHIQFSWFCFQFTEREYNTVVEPNKEATLEYPFQAGEVFAARQFGFVIELAYKDSVSLHAIIPFL